MKKCNTGFDVIEGQITFWEWLENHRQNKQILLEKEYAK